MAMMDNLFGSFWNDLLSRQPLLVNKAFSSLDREGQETVIAHLQRMVSEPGWQPEQVKSAQQALIIIKESSG
jgi:hypothetical protein